MTTENSYGDIGIEQPLTAKILISRYPGLKRSADPILPAHDVFPL